MFGRVGTFSATSEDMRFERALEKPSPAFSADSEPATAWKIFLFNARLLASAAGVLVALLMTTASILSRWLSSWPWPSRLSIGASASKTLNRQRDGIQGFHVVSLQ